MTNNITSGLRGLLASTKGAFCILTLASMTYLGSTGHLDGTAGAAGFSMIATVFCWTRQRTECEAIKAGGAPNPDPSFIEKIRATITGPQ